MFFCPTLADGGADRVLLTLLRNLDRTRFVPSLAVVHREGAFADEIPTDLEVHALGVPRLAAAVPALARVMQSTRPDVVFSTHGGSNIIAALAHSLARSRARLVLSERSALTRDDRGRVRKALEVPAKWLTYRRADLITAVSRGVAADIHARLGLPRQKVRVVYNPVVDDSMDALAREPVTHPWFGQDDRPVLLAVGRLVAIKDYPMLLAAFARIRARQPVRLVVLGEGPQRHALEQHAAELGIASDVAFLGFDKNPFKYMARAAVLLHASRAEGLPGVLIQAMACGAPVVATDCDHGPREVIERNVDGLLVPVGDARQLADSALRLLDNPSFARAIVERARRSAQRFSTAAAMQHYEAAIAGDLR